MNATESSNVVRTLAPVHPTRVTDGVGNDQLLYFTSSSLTSDDRTLVFISDRTGHPNLFALDIATGEARALTNQAEGVLRSYVYFDCTPHRGFGKASVSLDPVRRRVYWLQGDSLVRCEIDSGITRTLAQVRNDEVTAFTHVSADGSLICVPTTDGRAFDGEFANNHPKYDIDAKVVGENLSSYLNLFDTETGELVAREPVPRGWVTHVQFSPVDSNLVLYNHEWASDKGVRRIWLWDRRSGQHTQLRTENESRRRGDMVVHEYFDRTGEKVIYHGAFKGHRDDAHFIGVIDLKSGCHEYALPTDYQAYGHYTTGRTWDELITDGGYSTIGKSERNGRYLSLVRLGESGAPGWTPLCEHGSSWTSQDSHPHPIFNHAGDAVYFTSDRDGKRAVYRIDVPQDWRTGRSCRGEGN